MGATPYDPNLITSSVYGDRRPVTGEIVALLNITFQERGLKLIQSRSRALCEGEIHELMITDEEGAAPGGGADRVSAIAFFEVITGGLVVVRDRVTMKRDLLGTVAGYDMTHMPNHMNVLLNADSLEPPAIKMGDRLVFRKPR